MTDDRVDLKEVLIAARRMSGLAVRTPFVKSAWLSKASGAEVYLKLENLQTTGSFKFRGALNALGWAKENQRSKIFTASAGNHGLGVAEAAVHTGAEVTVCLPVNASAAKREKLNQYVERHGASIILHGQDCEVTESFARKLAADKDGFYVSPYNDRQVIAGQGTVALEMLEDQPELSKIIVAVGGGGLISGTAVAAKAINQAIEIVGVVAANSAAMTASIEAGKITDAEQSPTIADGLAGNIESGAITFAIARDLVDRWLTITESQIRRTVFEFLSNQGMLIEGAAATAVAAVTERMISLQAGEKLGIIICGGNISEPVWREIIVEHLTSIETEPARR